MITTRLTTSAPEVKSSVTALSVARAFARSVLTEYDYLFDIREAHLIHHLTEVGGQSLSGATWLLGKTLASLPYSFQQTFFNRAVVPGYDAVIMLRKLMIRQKIEFAIKNGVTQFVLLGGGYDIGGLVTAMKHPHVKVFEVDRGPTRNSKLAGLRDIPQGIGFDDIKMDDTSDDCSMVNANMFYLNADLSIDSLEDVLASTEFDKTLPTVIVMEGFTMYLNKKANQHVLEMVRSVMPDNSELIISFSTASMYSSLSKSVQTASNELNQFLLPHNEVIDFANQAGFAVTEQFSPSDALVDIGDVSAEYYKSKQNVRLETYYTFQKQDYIKQLTIEDVPVFKLTVPEKPAPKPSSGYCGLL